MAMLVVAGMVLGCATERGDDARRAREPRNVGRSAVHCEPPYRITILDLDMMPDPVQRGQRIETWRVTLQSDRDGACNTLLEIRDQNELVGRGVEGVIRPGRETYAVSAVQGYRLQQADRCFQVQVNVGGSASVLEARRSFCARALPGERWTLRER